MENRLDMAKSVYTKITKRFPSYIDAYLRLGCICRDQGRASEATDWFKEALTVNEVGGVRCALDASSQPLPNPSKPPADQPVDVDPDGQQPYARARLPACTEGV